MLDCSAGPSGFLIWGKSLVDGVRGPLLSMNNPPNTNRTISSGHPRTYFRWLQCLPRHFLRLHTIQRAEGCAEPREGDGKTN